MQAVYYRDSDGNEPVLDFLDTLPDRKRVVIDNQLERLNTLEPNEPPLPEPWTSQIEGELREFRAHYGEEHYRVLCRRSGNLFILLHAIRKTTRTVPRGDVVLAQARWPISGGAWTRPGASTHARPVTTHPELVRR